mgnify:CR=1 FL=1
MKQKLAKAILKVKKIILPGVGFEPGTTDLTLTALMAKTQTGNEIAQKGHCDQRS